MVSTVWNFCIPQGRIIRVKAWAYDRPLDTYRFRLEMEEDRSIPILFNICHETREIAQQTFTRGFDNIRDTEKLYWNPELDVFYLNLRTLRIRNPRFSRIRTLEDSFVMVHNIALRMGPGLWNSLTRGNCVYWLHDFPNLKHIRLIVESQEGCDPWDWTTTGYFTIPDVDGASEGSGYISASEISTDKENRPAYVQEVVTRILERYRVLFHPEWVPPVVEVFHMPDSESISHYQR
jgi:hypothetical protein